MTQEESIRSAGLEPENIQKFLAAMRRDHINLHSVLIQRGNRLVYEKYWAPFAADTPHRMYSVTKSFVSMAIGCLLDEGKIALDDPIVRYFPDKLPQEVSPLLARQTIRDMLTMRTCFAGGNWFRPGVVDRTAFYFSQKPQKPAGTVYFYDSTGSYILGVLAERLSGMKLIDYMKLKFLNRIGGFESARILETPDGTAWGDSAMVCTPRALMNFARLVMNLGQWEGEQLISRDYVQAAIARQTDNNSGDSDHHNGFGYGYQIWRTEQNGFSFNGMGSQFAVCVPDRDLIFVCTGDTQLTSGYDNPVIFRSVFDCLANPEKEGVEGLVDLNAQDALPVARGEKTSPFMEKINGAEFICEENEMGITRFRLEWDEKGQGAFLYENAQGEKTLPFGMKENWFGGFPQLGYSNDRGNVHEITDFRYRCAVSGGWIEEKKLQLRVQVIDRYFGMLYITIGFRDEKLAGVRMLKCAEDFFNEYNGWAIARRRED